MYWDDPLQTAGGGYYRYLTPTDSLVFRLYRLPFIDALDTCDGFFWRLATGAEEPPRLILDQLKLFKLDPQKPRPNFSRHKGNSHKVYQSHFSILITATI